MGQLFGSIYCWLEDFFGLELADYLWGQSSPEQQGNMFIGIGLAMLGISLAMMAVYYYMVNHPRLCNWWGWLSFAGANAVLNFIVGWQWVLKDYYDGLMVEKDAATGKMVDLPISHGDLFAFGVTNAIDGFVAFFVLSCIFKWWSTNCSRAPF